jgi:hypothetical protein
MELLRSPRRRLLLWALLLVAVAVAAGVAGLDWWLIVLVEFSAWALATLAERAIWDRTTPAPSEPALTEPEAEEAEEPAAPDHEPVCWNVAALERLAREHPESEHLRFLIVWLRQFADAAGELPADFDPLVRESFGDLIVG